MQSPDARQYSWKRFICAIARSSRADIRIARAKFLFIILSHVFILIFHSFIKQNARDIIYHLSPYVSLIPQIRIARINFQTAEREISGGRDGIETVLETRKLVNALYETSRCQHRRIYKLEYAKRVIITYIQHFPRLFVSFCSLMFGKISASIPTFIKQKITQDPLMSHYYFSAIISLFIHTYVFILIVCKILLQHPHGLFMIFFIAHFFPAAWPLRLIQGRHVTQHSRRQQNCRWDVQGIQTRTLKSARKFYVN